MTTLHEQLKTAASSYALTREEKRLMRRELSKRLFAHAVPSPYFSTIFMRSGAVFLLVILVGGGAATASQNALPGELLYSVKVDVVEPARGALAVSSAQKANWNAELVVKRAEEAETLAADGKLSEAVASTLSRRIEASVTAAETARAQTEAESEEEDAEIDSSLSAHGQILAELAGQSDDESTQKSGRTLAGFLRSWSRSRTVATVATESTATLAMSAEPTPTTLSAPSPSAKMVVAQSAPASSPEEAVSDTNEAVQESPVVAKLRVNVNASLAKAEARFEAMSDSLDDSTSANIEARLDALTARTKEASDAWTLQQILRDTTRLSTYLEASARFERKDILGPVLDNDDADSWGNENDDHSSRWWNRD